MQSNLENVVVGDYVLLVLNKKNNNRESIEKIKDVRKNVIELHGRMYPYYEHETGKALRASKNSEYQGSKIILPTKEQIEEYKNNEKIFKLKNVLSNARELNINIEQAEQIIKILNLDLD